MRSLPTFRVDVLRNGDAAHAIIDPLTFSVAPQRVRCLDVSDLPSDVVAVHVVGAIADWQQHTPLIARLAAMVRLSNGNELVAEFSDVCPAIPMVLYLRIVPMAGASMLFHEEPGLVGEAEQRALQ